MGKMKKILTIVLAAFLLTAAVAVPAATTTEAAVSKITVQKAISIGVGTADSNVLYVQFPKAYTIKNLKAYLGKKKTSNLKCKVIYTVDRTYKDSAEDNEYSRQILLYATKAGNYKLKFDVYDGSKKVTTKTVKVYAAPGGNVPFKKITMGSTVLFDSSWPAESRRSVYYSIPAKGKFKVAPNKGIKIKSIKMSTYGKNGKYKTKTIKNGKKITLGKVGYRYTDSIDNEYEKYNYESKQYWAYTNILITYTNKYSPDPKAEIVYTITLPVKATSWAKSAE